MTHRYDFHDAHLPQTPAGAALSYRKAMALPDLASQDDIDAMLRRSVWYRARRLNWAAIVGWCVVMPAVAYGFWWAVARALALVVL